jgi:hypothetical protein
VNEEISATFVGRDEAETLFSVEPLHGTLSHSNFLEMSLERFWPDTSQARGHGTTKTTDGRISGMGKRIWVFAKE